MPDTTLDHSALLRPEDVAALVVQPVDDASVAIAASTLVTTDSERFRVPIVVDDVASGWFAEGAEITQTSADTDELVIVPRKLAALSVISNELALDSSPAAQEVVGQSIARDIARRLDAAYFGTAVGAAPPGLGNLVGFGAVDAGAAWSNLDAFSQAIFAAEAEGRTIDTFVANPADALILSTLKDQADSSRPLLGAATDETTRRVLGVPLTVSPAVAIGTVWGLPRSVSMVVRRTNITLAVDNSRYFERDSVGVRATMRVAFGCPHPAAVQKISLTA